MKILKNTKNKSEDINSYPRKLICENCKSELEYDESDLRMGEYGYMFIDCPVCGEGSMLENNEHSIILTVDNIEFPIHFHHTNNENAVDACNTEEIRNGLKRAINYFRNNKDEYVWYSWFGNLFILVHKWSGDEEYEVVVSNDFYSMAIPFEDEDYGW